MAIVRRRAMQGNAAQSKVFFDLIERVGFPVPLNMRRRGRRPIAIPPSEKGKNNFKKYQLNPYCFNHMQASEFCSWASRIARGRKMDSKHSTHQRQLTVRISRGTEDGTFSTYSVPWRENQTVLDVVTEVQRTQEPGLSYRYACRVGVCGSCAMTVNGKPRWTCRTHVSRVEEGGVIVIEPLRNMPRIKDLVVDMREFFQKWARAGNTFVGTATRNDPPATVLPQSKKRKLADAAIECINCGVCYAACDVVSWDKEYLGPAALNRAWTLFNDERHADPKDVLHKATSGSGCNSCHTQGSCMTHCPVSLSPTGSIAGLKRSSLLSLLKGG